jgi:hypothetical protein
LAAYAGSDMPMPPAIVPNKIAWLYVLS